MLLLDILYLSLVTLFEQSPGGLQNTLLAFIHLQAPQSHRGWRVGWWCYDPWAVYKFHIFQNVHLLHGSGGDTGKENDHRNKLGKKDITLSWHIVSDPHNEWNLQYDNDPSLFVSYFVIPLLTPALHARIPFMLLMRLLFPTLGKPEDTRILCETGFSLT